LRTRREPLHVWDSSRRRLRGAARCQAALRVVKLVYAVEDNKRSLLHGGAVVTLLRLLLHGPAGMRQQAAQLLPALATFENHPSPDWAAAACLSVRWLVSRILRVPTPTEGTVVAPAWHRTAPDLAEAHLFGCVAELLVYDLLQDLSRRTAPTGPLEARRQAAAVWMRPEDVNRADDPTFELPVYDDSGETRRARWVTLISCWVTVIARWVTHTACW
jgi:hypothetical protein